MTWHDMIWYMVYRLHAYMQVCKWRCVCVCVHLCKDVMIVLLRGTYATVVPIYFVSETTLWAILRMAAGTLRLTKIRRDSPTHVGIAHKPIDIWTHWHSQKIWESVLGFSFRRCWGVQIAPETAIWWHNVLCALTRCPHRADPSCTCTWPQPPQPLAMDSLRWSYDAGFNQCRTRKTCWIIIPLPGPG